MRYLIIEEPMYGRKPFVIAETPDGDWARDQQFLNSVVVLSETEAALDPDYEAVAAAWWARDDTSFGEEAVLAEAEGQLPPASVEASHEGLIEETPLEAPPEGSTYDDRSSILWIFGRPDSPPSTPLTAYYQATLGMNAILHRAQHDFGAKVAATLSRVVAYDVAQFSRRSDEVQS